MKIDSHYQGRKQLLWGLLVIAIGASCLFERLGWFDIEQLWHAWPLLLLLLLLLLLSGIQQRLPPTYPRRI
ncbi:HAMP domain-containing protein [Oxalobacteraceae bacterium GrIS 1.11]